MPLYDYRCSECGCEREVLQNTMTDIECCGKTMDRIISAPMVKIKGEGGYPSRRKQIRNTTYRIHPKLEHESNRVYI